MEPGIINFSVVFSLFKLISYDRGPFTPVMNISLYSGLLMVINRGCHVPDIAVISHE